MAIEDSIYAALSSDSGILSAFGLSTGSSVPIFPDQSPANQAVPYVVYNLINGNPDQTHLDDSQLQESLFQFSIYAGDYDTGRSIRKAIYKAFAALSATGLAAGEKFTLEAARNPGFDIQTDTYHLIQEVRFWHDPTA